MAPAELALNNISSVLECVTDPHGVISSAPIVLCPLILRSVVARLAPIAAIPVRRRLLRHRRIKSTGNFSIELKGDRRETSALLLSVQSVTLLEREERG